MRLFINSVWALTAMFWIFLAFSGCRSEHSIKASGTATVKHVISIEFAACDTLPDPDRLECVKTFLEILEAAIKAQEAGNGGPLLPTSGGMQ